MRITGGEAKGRVVRVPRGFRFRPTTDLIRESLFNIINPAAGKSFLDLFAGSGLVGFEALSRGATLAVFVEKDFRASEEVRRVASLFGFADKCEVMTASVDRALGTLWGRGRVFDVIFADPPYHEGLTVETMRLFGKGDGMAPGGMLILQHSVREKVEKPVGGPLRLMDQRRYGETYLSFFVKNDADDDSGYK